MSSRAGNSIKTGGKDAMQLTHQDAWQQRAGSFPSETRATNHPKDGRLRWELIPQLGKPLSPREIEALDYLRAGLSHAQTGARMGLRAFSAKAYVTRAMEKMGTTAQEWRKQGMPAEVARQ